MTELAHVLAELTPDAVRSEADRLSAQAKRLYAMADAMEAAGPGPAGETAPQAPKPDGQSGSKPNGRSGSSKRPVILELMTERPSPPWSPAEMRDALNARGFEIAGDSTRVTMIRMAKAGQLVRIREGQYTLPGHEPGRLE